MSKAEGCIVPPWWHRQEWCVPVLALPLGTWPRVPDLLHIRSVQMFWLQFTGCHWGQLGLSSYGGTRNRIFPLPAQLRALSGCYWLICRTRCLYECIGKCRALSHKFLLSFFHNCLSCAWVRCSTKFSCTLEKLLQVWAGFWASWHFDPLGAK